MTRCLRCSRADRGFTLVEVLVALVIVTIGMATVLGTLTSSANTVVYLRDKMLANFVALNQIATVRLHSSTTRPTQGKTEGDTDYAGRTWHWRQDIINAEVNGMVRIEVKVRPDDGKHLNTDDTGWYTTETGLWGDALTQARGDLPSWSATGTTNGRSATNTTSSSSSSGTSTTSSGSGSTTQ